MQYQLLSCIGWVVLFYLMARIGGTYIPYVAQKRNASADFISLLCQSFKAMSYVSGAVAIMITLGVDVKALITGFGLTGFAVGYALKDIVANFVSGILLVLYRPLCRNDEVQVNGFKGRVDAIDLRYTVLDDEGNKVFIPNSMLFSNIITIFHNTNKKEELQLGVLRKDEFEDAAFKQMNSSHF